MAVTPYLPTTAETVADLEHLHPGLAARADDDDRLAAALVRIVDVSRSLTTSIRRDPDVLAEVADGDAFRTERDLDDYLAGWQIARTAAADPTTELRRFKRRELLRIVARDLLGIADLPTVGRELASLADATLIAATELVEPTVPFAVIGMGKLGGHELNYSSDIDVIFVHEGDTGPAVSAARRLISLLASPAPEGMVWRVDADLRPEGKTGVLSRTPESCRVYYESWGEPWERQALLKARYCAGDRDVARAFFDAVLPSVWTTRLRPDAVDHIRHLKDRAEGLAQARTDRDLKRGPGGIRDVEFAVQLLQLVHGGADPTLRSPNTINAIRALVRAGHLDQRDGDHFIVAYRYLRTVEHRIQLRDERQTQELPAGDAELDWLARVMGHHDGPQVSASDAFLVQLERYRTSVRTIHQRVFRRPTITALLASPAIEAGIADRLASLGFREPDRGAELLERVSGGHTTGARLLRELTPLLLDALAESTEPDLGLLRLTWIIDGPARRDRILAAFRESPELIGRTCRLLGSSAVVAGALRADPDLVDVLGGEPAPTDPALAEELTSALTDLDDTAPALTVVRREQTRLAAATLLDGLSTPAVGTSLTALAQATMEAGLALVADDALLAVIGVGRFGTHDLSFHSDLDVIIVADPTDDEAVRGAERAAQRLVSSFNDQRGGGRLWEVDARLRPEGANGRMAPSLAACERYYTERAQLWEFQALTRARPVAGDAAIAARFMALVEPLVYRPDFGDDDLDEFRHMKHRIETERRPAGPTGATHLKLGPGGLIDVEFAVQLLQLRHGHALPQLRGISPTAALPLLAGAGLVTTTQADDLAAAYRFCERLRNIRHLHRAREPDVFPDDPDDAESFAALCGFESADDLTTTHQRLTEAARAAVDDIVG